MAKLMMRLVCNTDALESALDDLEAALAASSDSLKERVQLLFDVPEFFKELFSFEVDSDAATADETAVLLNPSDRFGVLLAALRAGDVEGLVVEYVGHADFLS